MSGIALLASRLKSGRSSGNSKHTDSFITFTSRIDLEEADFLDEVFPHPRAPPSVKKEPREMKTLDLGKIASFAERMRARRLLNDILDQWSSFSSMSRSTREASVVSLQRTMASARLRLLGSSLQTLQVVSARLTGSLSSRLPPRADELTFEKTVLVTIPQKTVHLTTAQPSNSIALDGDEHFGLTAGVNKAVADILRIEKLLAN